MKPRAPDDPAESQHRLREQLILAQVRIMELEDLRDESAARQVEIEALLKGAQTLADAKIDALAHLENVHADLQAQYQHMRHMQHVTNEALNETRRELAAVIARLQQAEAQVRGLEAQDQNLRHELATVETRARQLDESLRRLGDRCDQLERDLTEARTTGATRLERIGQLDSELRAMKASRSWRWSRPIRAAERWLARHRRPS
jgi:chromosome segregation ATPase